MVHLEGLSEGLLKIYDAAYSKDGWSDAMEACRRATSATHTLYYAVGTNDAITFSAKGCSPTLAPYKKSFEEYNHRFARPGNTGYDDVGLAFMQNSEVGAPIMDTDIWTLDWLENRPELQHNIEHFGIFRKMYINTSHDPLINAGIHFWYDTSHHSILGPDISTAAALGPHLAKAFDIARWAHGLRRKHQAVLSVLDRIELGVCVADGQGRIILSNAQAKDIFSESDGVWCDMSDMLATSNPELTSSIRVAVQDIAQTARGENDRNSVEFSIARKGFGSPLLLIVSPLRDADMELERNLHGCLITIVDTERPADLRLDAFGTAYHFTPMEKKAAGLLVIGLTTPEIGEELGVATSTAQTHVKSVFHKTRSSNRVNFVWRAVQFSPQIS